MKAAWVLAASLVLSAAPASGQNVGERTLHIDFEPDNKVTLIAHHVTPREILAEWARRCGCYVVNADRMPGGPNAIPIVFEGAPQAVVLRTLLKDAAGYALTPKRTGAVSASDFETIYILPTSSASSVGYVAERPMAPAFQPAPVATPGSPDDEIEPVRRVDTRDAVDAPNPSEEAPQQQQKRGFEIGVPGMSVPGVRIIPIAPGSSSSTPTQQPGQATPVAPGTTTPAPGGNRVSP